ncbi:hypothetical protein H4219_000305 [Mycoemilia scoparia]|uniref:Translationally-controlled tumor protein homolog n=1 Tax=Mycoemilia scoparia TaxID=417184 RepID=A0A9W8AC79_9FUNG|nr:hypothetical protein H4219_000305 [Mycoemilia scoparia]
MLVFNDIISGDELFSDAYPLKEINDIVYEVDCKLVQVKEGVDVDIGANPSAEGGDDDLDEAGVSTVNNVVHSFGLQSTQFDKKTYMTYIKGYMKSIEKHLKEENPDRVDKFKAGASAVIKKILGNIKDYEFYTGGSMNPDGMVALLNYREDGITPYFTFFKDGVKAIKC